MNATMREAMDLVGEMGELCGVPLCGKMVAGGAWCGDVDAVWRALESLAVPFEVGDLNYVVSQPVEVDGVSVRVYVKRVHAGFELCVSPTLAADAWCDEFGDILFEWCDVCKRGPKCVEEEQFTPVRKALARAAERGERFRKARVPVALTYVQLYLFDELEVPLSRDRVLVCKLVGYWEDDDYSFDCAVVPLGERQGGVYVPYELLADEDFSEGEECEDVCKRPRLN